MAIICNICAMSDVNDISFTENGYLMSECLSGYTCLRNALLYSFTVWVDL